MGRPNAEQTLDNLCGDLNKGYLPLNPMNQNVDGVSYPFELLKRKTLAFFSRTLPILKADDTLPKVAKYEDAHIAYNPAIFNSKPANRISFYHHRQKRAEEDVAQDKLAEQVEDKEKQLPRQGRGSKDEGWCHESDGVFCMLINAFKGASSTGKGKVDRIGGDSDVPSLSSLNSLEHPMTPCPSAVEYVTPVFAKNYQGVWRYVVQIPYEGYFTQTVEVVKCLSTKCEYLDGSCLASPRWVSLLVSEIYYPDTTFPSNGGGFSHNRNPVQGSSPPQQDLKSYFLKRRSGVTEASNCDGHDEMGCYQVRLYYDWFLIPGSCKCWKNDFFEQYTKKR